MPAPLRITLSKTEDLTLQELSMANTVSRIAEHLKQSPHTVRQTIRH
ncbi:MAG: hypothetical protein AAF652_10130 [Cyanobacteria bacterium P01_C01_bin.72]